MFSPSQAEKLRNTEEYRRLADSNARRADWKHWGPYLSERAWGTVREDYSPDGSAWEYFPHDHARSRTYRWNEDGLGGICNRFQNACLAIALWNEKDPILKERLFGLTGLEGNHGEDVKEYYFYLDNLPSHAYFKMLYRYPQAAFPYQALVEENQRRSRQEPEYELMEAMPDVFNEHRFFDIYIEYARAAQEDILCRVTAINRGPEPAPLHVLPHLWYRNTWSWGHNPQRPTLQRISNSTQGYQVVYGRHRHLNERWWYLKGSPKLLFTENNTNHEHIFNTPNTSPYVKDAFHRFIISGEESAVNPAEEGTKAAGHYTAVIPPGESFTICTRYVDQELPTPFEDFESVFEKRIHEADDFYAKLHPLSLGEDEKRIQRQALAGLLWTKQFYHYAVELWLNGDPDQPEPPTSRLEGRNSNWEHLTAMDEHAVPDKWEYPWFAAWDTAFHTITLALVDPEWAKRQHILLLREWYTHPNGQIPAYEWAFSDVNPPVQAWAALRVYQITRQLTGEADTLFLERVFQKLLLNFTWWVNRKDVEGRNIFQGGFLGLDNIGVFDRSKPLPTGGHIEQADGTAWMGMYCLMMLAISLELARTRPAYEDVATKFFEHFVYIADAITHLSGEEVSLWDEEDGFFYDMLHLPNGENHPLKVCSFVGLIPLFAVEILDEDLLEKLSRFKRRMDWFLHYRPHLVKGIASLEEPGVSGGRLLSIVNQDQLVRVLKPMLDQGEFLSDYGLRSLSRRHLEQPFTFYSNGQVFTVSYEPGESTSDLFGGNSNWRGPVWFPVNYLMIEALQRYHRYYGDSLKVEFPTGSGNQLNLNQISVEISRRLMHIFLRDDAGRRPVFGETSIFQTDPLWRDYIPFYEYFHGENGTGLGASHQTGWTALIANLLQHCGGDRPAK